MKTRSIVFDVFGSYVRYRGGSIAIGDLADILSWFGVTEDATRVTMSRMRREGWFTTRRNGRTSYYELSDRGWSLLQGGRDRIFGRHRGAWTGEWHIVLLQHDAPTAAGRDNVRKEMVWRGYAQVAPSTWIASRDQTEGLADLLGDGVHVQAFAARTFSPDEDRRIAAENWDLDGLADDYRSFVRTYEPLMSPSAISSLSDEEALVRRTEITHEYRLFPFRDPDLPADLLPSDWPGYEAHGLFLHLVDELADRAWAAFDRVYGRPPPSPSDVPERALG